MDATMLHDEPAGIAVAPGETKALTMVFIEPGELLAGCHVPGHHAADLKAAICIVP